MKQTITRLFDNRTDAEAAVTDLESRGVHARDISLLAPAAGPDTKAAFSDQPITRTHKTEAGPAAGFGATTGALIGAGAGLLAGLGMIVIPGIGPLLAAGWIATTLGGAVAGGVAGGAIGGVVGALVDAGVPEEDAHVYAEGVRRGGSLVVVRCDAHDAAKVEEILNRERGVEARTRGEVYRQEGWTRFDPSVAQVRAVDVPPVADTNAAPVEDPVIRSPEPVVETEADRERRIARDTETTPLIDRVDP
jgi:hypothetical protein